MKREVFAKILVDDEVNNGFVINTLEKQALEMAHCELDEAVCAESDSDSRHERYINYLINWAIEHNDETYEGCSPASFDEFEDCEDDYDEDECQYDIACRIDEDDYILDEQTGNIIIPRAYANVRYKVGQIIKVWFVDEDEEPLKTYKVIETTETQLVCEYIG